MDKVILKKGVDILRNHDGINSTVTINFCGQECNIQKDLEKLVEKILNVPNDGSSNE